MRTDTKVYRPQYPTEIIGETYHDNVMDATIHRLTDSQIYAIGETIDPIKIPLGGNFSNSEYHISNLDETCFFCQRSILKDGRWRQLTCLYDRTMLPIYELPKGIGPAKIRWSQTNPQELLIFTPGRIYVYNVKTRKNRYIAIVPIITAMAGGEAEVSLNNQIILNSATRLIHYDMNKLKIISQSPYEIPIGKIGIITQAQTIDYAAMSPKGDHIIIAWANGVPGHRGIEVFDLDWNFERWIYPGEIHFYATVDMNGDQVIYTCLPNDPVFLAPYKKLKYKAGDFAKINIETGIITKLLDVPKWSHFMITQRRNHPEVVYVTWMERDLGKDLLGRSKWSLYFGELVEVATDGSGKARRLCHTYCKPVEGIAKPPKFFQPDNNSFGDKILFRSCIKNSNGVGDVFYCKV